MLSQKRGWLLCVSALVFLTANVASAGMIITGVSRTNSTKQAPGIAPGFIDFADNGKSPADQDVGALGNGSYAFVDRTHAYVDANATLEPFPTFLVGADYVLNANDDKSDDNVLIDVTFSDQVTTVYLVIDNRVAVGDTKMAWVGALGFTDTGSDLGIDESKDGVANQLSSVWSLNVSGPTTITFGEQNDGGSRNMYGIAAVPEPATLGLLAIGAVGVLIRRKRR